MNARGLIAAVLGLLACSVPVPFAEDLFFTTDRPQLPEAADCRRCHGAVYEEWAGSLHATAWTSETFAAVTGDHAAGDCLGCHAPAPLGSDGEVRLRDDHRDEGVTCISCHLSEVPSGDRLTMRGPHEPTSPVEVHAITRDTLFLRAELCGGCHEGVLEQWRDSPEPDDGSPRATCQECHMPAVRRTMETYDPEKPYSALLVALGDPVDGRRHRFEVPPDPWEDIDVETRAVAGSLRVRVANRLPHAIPTGRFGVRVARIRVTWPGGERERLLRADLDEAVPAGQSRVYEFDGVPATAAAVLERRVPKTGRFERLAPAPTPTPTPGNETGRDGEDAR
ncbi:MAG: hypothetical protein JRG76_19130 [Deltaproteobacteria bacterium]|nr:hypothetical protein [Deltaproteobacteria bacterium]